MAQQPGFFGQILEGARAEAQSESGFKYDVPYPAVTEASDEYAARMRANIARAQWEDYLERFQPYEDRLIAMAEEGPEQLLGDVTQMAGRQHDIGMQAGLRQRSRYGLQQGYSPSERRVNEITRTADIVGARNQAREAYQQQRTGLLGGGYGGG